VAPGNYFYIWIKQVEGMYTVRLCHVCLLIILLYFIFLRLKCSTHYMYASG